MFNLRDEGIQTRTLFPASITRADPDEQWDPPPGLSYLHPLLDHGRPLHDEVSTHAGRPAVLKGPDVAEDVGPLRGERQETLKVQRHIYIEDAFLSKMAHNKYICQKKEKHQYSAVRE